MTRRGEDGRPLSKLERLLIDRENKPRTRWSRCKLCDTKAPCGKCASCGQPWECQNCHKCRYCAVTAAKKDWGYASYTTGAEIEDREFRAAYPYLKLRSAYLNVVGESPVLRAGDVGGAAEMVRRVERAIERGGWTRGENARLHVMLDKWQRRAAGADARFMVMGTVRGNPTKQQRQQISTMQALENIKVMLDGEAEGNISLTKAARR